MKLNVLISCMHENDTSIIHRCNVQTDVVVVNQCNIDSVEEFNFRNKKGEVCHAKFINTTERGLSRSRNMAIANAWGDICQISDDDEFFPDNHADVILEAYSKYPNAGIITFALIRNDCEKTFSLKESKLRFKDLLSTSSVQITFLLKMVRKARIRFDEKMGSGTGNGGGEENKFLLDCKRKGINMYYYPSIIAVINSNDSKWFKGYTEKYFRDKGWVARRMLGFMTGYLFILYNIFNHRNIFTKDGLSFVDILINVTKGFFEKR